MVNSLCKYSKGGKMIYSFIDFLKKICKGGNMIYSFIFPLYIFLPPKNK